MKRDLLSINDLTEKDIALILQKTKILKKMRKSNRKLNQLQDKTLALIFFKPSTRTRISFEVAMYELGGNVTYLSGDEIQISRGEPCADTAKVLSRYVHGIVIRTFSHSEVLELAQNSTIPVINGLTDLEHPCQILADLFTIYERHKKLDGLKIAFIGDGNNVANSWLLAAPKVNANFVLACPRGYEPDSGIVSSAIKEAKRKGVHIEVINDPKLAAKSADVIYTDVWISMGQEKDAKAKKSQFNRFQVNKNLLALAKPECMIMHCLPAHRGEEITADVIDGKNSVVWEQAENRLHVEKTILSLLLK
ncbi:MAG: ornithine carbamoyltransferase [Candidatus Firestonebacteria bacterium]|mgnify:CR=1 FL=1